MIMHQNRISIPSELYIRVKKIYDTYRQQPPRTLVDKNLVLRAHKLFAELISQTDDVRCEYEFRRRLVNSSNDLNNLDSLPQKIVATYAWLNSAKTINALQAENILHNLFFCIDLHSFWPDAKEVFNELDLFCCEVEEKGILE
jgi:hypothetical protein